MRDESSEALYELRESGIHNRGLFATADIPKGTRVIEYIGEKITKKESERRALEWEEQARESGEGLVYIFDLNKRYDLDGNVPDNIARFINHSCEENCEAINQRGKIYIYSRRDIAEGEELTFDYGYDLATFMEHPCKCGTERCIGYIVRRDLRGKLKRILKNRRRRLDGSKGGKKGGDSGAGEAARKGGGRKRRGGKRSRRSRSD
ncbi:MAG: SET domain-containing protein [Opitutales bacterium]